MSFMVLVLAELAPRCKPYALRPPFVMLGPSVVASLRGRA